VKQSPAVQQLPQTVSQAAAEFDLVARAGAVPHAQLTRAGGDLERQTKRLAVNRPASIRAFGANSSRRNGVMVVCPGWATGLRLAVPAAAGGLDPQSLSGL